MNLAVKINNEDKTTLIGWESFDFDDVVNNSANTCEFGIIVHAGQTYVPQELDEIEIYDESQKIFAGRLTEIEDEIAGKVITYTITASDWTFDLERMPVTERYQNMTVGEIIADLIANYMPGLGATGNNVDCDVMVKSISFNTISVSQAIQTLAERVNYSWYIDYDKDIHFFAKNTEPAPFGLDSGSGNFIWDSLKIKKGISQMRNAVTIRGGEKTATVAKTKHHTGDGSQTTFNTDYKFAGKPTVTVNGVSMTVGIDNIDSDADYDCMWNYEQKYIRFVAAPADGAAIQIAGYPLVPIVVAMEDASSISKYKVRYELAKTDKSIATEDEAVQYALAQLEAYGQSIREGSFTTYTSGLKSGQTIYINIPERNISESFIIQRVKLRMFSAFEGEWIIELATMRSIGIIDFLQKLLLGQSNTIEVDDNAVLEKYPVINETVGVSEEISVITPMDNSEQIGVSENIIRDPFGAGVKPRWVFGRHFPESDSDRNREAFWGRATFNK